MAKEKSLEVFFELLRAGLWNREARLATYDDIDYSSINNLSEEQSVVGLITAGLERVKDIKVPKEVTLQFIGSTLQIEQRNKEMDLFVARLIDRLRKYDIYTLLVKGQGLAQCYEKPLWRSCGDVDLYLSDNNYQAAKKILCPLASCIDIEDTDKFHLALTIDGWVVELHGSLHSDISSKVNAVLDGVHRDIFNGGEIRSWNNKGVTVFLPSADNDVIIVFAHILQHFFVEGIGLRQICDWCRLLWTYREAIDLQLLEKRISQMKMMTEWKAFGAMAVEYLGMPEEAMPFYDSRFKVKGEKIVPLILDTGTFGHNRDLSYKDQDSFMRRLFKSFKRRNGDSLRQISIFPLDGLKMWWKMIVLGVGVAVRGK